MTKQQLLELEELLNQFTNEYGGDMHDDRFTACIGAMQTVNGIVLEGKYEVADMRIEEMDFSVRMYNVLARSGVRFQSDITQYTESEFIRVTRNISKKNVIELKDKMNEFGFKFKDEE